MLRAPFPVQIRSHALSSTRAETNGLRAAAARLAFPVVVALVVSAAPAAAQDAPDGGFASSQASEEEVGWGGTADFGLTVTSGNSETTNLSLAARATREFARQRLNLAGSYLRTTEDGEEVANRGEVGAAYRYFPNPRFYLTGRATGSFNEPAGLELRLSPGLGAGWVLAAGDGYQLSAEAGATWIRDAFVDGSSTTSVYYAAAQSFTLQVSDNTTLDQELRYNPRAGDFSDYLLHGEVTLTTQITDAIGIRVRAIDDFDATPFQGAPGEPPAEKNDLTLVTGVSVQW